MTSLLPGLSAVASDYDAVLCDVWGVVHNGREAFAGAVEALQQFRKTRPLCTTPHTSQSTAS